MDSLSLDFCILFKDLFKLLQVFEAFAASYIYFILLVSHLLLLFL